MISFCENYKFVELNNEFHIIQVYEINTPTSVFLFQTCQNFIEKVVNMVKQNLFTEKFLKISLTRKDSTLELDLSRNQLVGMARALYRHYGIEIQEVDQLESPREILFTWHRDHPFFNPISNYAVKALQQHSLIDCAFKFKDKLFPAHKIVLAAKSHRFEIMFKNGFKEAKFGAEIEVVMEGLQEKSVELLRDYLYKDKLELKEYSVEIIDNLINLSSYFELPHLQYVCIEHLCQTINENNVLDYLKLAKYYEYDELYTALLEHLKPQINADNYETILIIADCEDLKELKTISENGLIDSIRKIDYEPMGFGSSESSYKIVLFLNFGIKIQNQKIVLRCFKQIKKVLNHPGYGAHLEKTLVYLWLFYEYQSQLDWLDSEALKGVIEQRKCLYDDVLESIVRRGSYESNFRLKLMECCLKMAQQFHLTSMQEATSKVLVSKIKDFDELSIKECLDMAKKYQLNELTQACEKYRA